MTPTEPITDFRGEHAFLSNFYASPVTLDNAEYPTVEHAYQAAKTDDFELRRRVRAAKSPNAAKQMGKRIPRRDDWFDVSLTIMEDLIRQKFTRYPDLAAKLLATGETLLIEGNNWNDRFFGAVWDSHREAWVGENHLGRMLMTVRAELKTSS